MIDINKLPQHPVVVALRHRERKNMATLTSKITTGARTFADCQVITV